MFKKPLAFLACAGLVPVSHAAPLDTLLSTRLGPDGWGGDIELGIDRINDTLDVFDIRGQDKEFAGTNVGDYEGWHVRGGVNIGKRLRVEGGFWDRGLYFGSDWADITSWQLAAQWQLFDQEGNRPSLAVRYSYWGDGSDELQKSSSVNFNGVKVDDIRITDTEDRQQQLNLIASWVIDPAWEVSLFAGGGKSKVDFGDLYATWDNCEYRLSSPTEHSIAGVADNPGAACYGASFSFKDPSASYPGPDLDIAYDATYYQVGGNVGWRGESWRARLGYHYQTLERDVDAAVKAAGKQSYDANHMLTAELGYGLAKNVDLFLRGQYFKQQFVGEIPFAYNVYTAHRFDKHYGFVTLGLTVGF